ncbi:MAG: hypothetical protein ACKOA8_19080 [Deltaproteobacteria bacterium]
MILLVLCGGARFYSDIPYMDMWDGTIDFFMRARSGRWYPWWEQHNEHRILLSRLLFWVDLQWLGGRSVFLVFMNYFFAFSIPAVFWGILKERKQEAKLPIDDSTTILGLLLTSWLLLWCQKENLVWAFQSQFFLSQLLPLAALWSAHKAFTRANSTFYFVFACLLGVASTWTMANGISVLPLIAVYSVFQGQPVRRTATLVLFSALSLGTYFYDYHSPSTHGLLSKTLLHEPLLSLNYTFTYLGSPFNYLLGKGPLGRWAAFAGGLSLVVLTVKSFLSLIHRKTRPSDSMLLFYLVYIIGTALGTAGGRLIFGVEQAISERYTTPALMAWVTLVILFEESFKNLFEHKNKKLSRSLIGLLMLLMLIKQLGVFSKTNSELNRRKLAALALELQINDQEIIKTIYPNASRAIRIAKLASDQKISIFGYFPFKGLRDSLGKVSSLPVSSHNCQIEAISSRSIADDKLFNRIEGNMDRNSSKAISPLLYLLDENHHIVGFAMADISTGKFNGYFRSSALDRGLGLIVKDEHNTCLSSVQVKYST